MSHAMLQHFQYDHLPPELAEVSRKFCDLATELDRLLHESDMKTVCLLRLLESKDAAVRQRNVDMKNEVRDKRILEVKEQLYPKGIPNGGVPG